MHQQVIETICALEEKLDTNSFVYGDVNYWPLCRLRLWSHLISQTLKSNRTQAKTISNTGPTFPDVGQVKAFPIAEPELGLVHVDRRAAVQISEQSLPKPEILFFLRPEEYRDQVDGLAYAKMLDSLYDRAADYRRLKIELANPQTMSFRRRNNSAFFHSQLVAKFAHFDPSYQAVSFESLEAELGGIDCRNVIDAESIAADMGKIFYHARLFEVLLLATQPKAVFLSVYYHPVGMALMLAARRLNIVTVDMQHGRLGPHHGLYTHLTAAPDDGYALLPDYVWCWGAQTKYDIEVERASNCGRHGGLVGGNPWIDHWRDKNSNEDDPQLRAFLDSFADNKKILVSLQPLETPLPDFVIDAMASGPANWTWWLRLHPLRRHTVDELSDLLTKRGIDNFELQDSTDLPLFTLLKHCNHHVTAFSSVALEALAFGRRTTLTTEAGRQIFSNYVDSGSFNIAETTDTLLEAIQIAIDAPPPDNERPFIDTRSGLAESVLAEILSKGDDTVDTQT